MFIIIYTAEKNKFAQPWEKPIRFQNQSVMLTLYFDHNIFRTPSSNKYTCIQSMGCPFELLFPLSRSDKFE